MFDSHLLNPSIPDPNGTCHLALLSPDIKSEIIRYVDCESDEEFLARTHASRELSSEHLKMVRRHEEKLINNHQNIARAYSIDQCCIISAFYKSVQQPYYIPVVIITDIIENTHTRNSKLALSLNNDQISSYPPLIALSKDNGFFAQLIRNGETSSPAIPPRIMQKRENVARISESKHYLYINHSASTSWNGRSLKRKKITLQGIFPTSISFNEQGNKMVVWHRPINSSDVQPRIIPLTPSVRPISAANKTLDAYFLHIGCCKDLSKSLSTS